MRKRFIAWLFAVFGEMSGYDDMLCVAASVERGQIAPRIKSALQLQTLTCVGYVASALSCTNSALADRESVTLALALARTAALARTDPHQNANKKSTHTCT